MHSPHQNESSIARYRDQNVAMRPVKSLDIRQLEGEWFEVAHFPNFMTKNRTATRINFEPVQGGEFSFSTKYRNEHPFGPEHEVHGKAKVTGPAEFFVLYEPETNFANQEIWVLGVYDEYELAILGNPEGTLGSVLSRQAELSASQWHWTRGVLRDNGYDLHELNIIPHLEETNLQ